VIRALVLAALLATPAPAVRFATVEITLAADHPIAAWQVELVVTAGDARIVGVEGGEAPFAEPPRYDPAALAGGRIILAAFDTHAALPAGRHRVAIVHVRAAGPAAYSVRVAAAADPDGTRITANGAAHASE